jgi:hypothetical protein
MTQRIEWLNDIDARVADLPSAQSPHSMITMIIELCFTVGVTVSEPGGSRDDFADPGMCD